jgi:hypothetical protein
VGPGSLPWHRSTAHPTPFQPGERAALYLLFTNSEYMLDIKPVDMTVAARLASVAVVGLSRRALAGAVRGP